MAIHASPHRANNVGCVYLEFFQKHFHLVRGVEVRELPALSCAGRNSNPHNVTVLSDENNIIKRRVRKAIEKLRPIRENTHDDLRKCFTNNMTSKSAEKK